MSKAAGLYEALSQGNARLFYIISVYRITLFETINTYQHPHPVTSSPLSVLSFQFRRLFHRSLSLDDFATSSYLTHLPLPSMSMNTTMTSSISSALLHVVLGLVFIIFSTSLWSYLRSPTLIAIPGPLVAKFTNLWRLISAYRGLTAVYSRRLHERHGTAVRLGPNLVSLSDPKLIKTLYSFKGDYKKVY